MPAFSAKLSWLSNGTCFSFLVNNLCL